MNQSSMLVGCPCENLSEWETGMKRSWTVIVGVKMRFTIMHKSNELHSTLASPKVEINVSPLEKISFVLKLCIFLIYSGIHKQLRLQLESGTCF